MNLSTANNGKGMHPMLATLLQKKLAAMPDDHPLKPMLPALMERAGLSLSSTASDVHPATQMLLERLGNMKADADVGGKAQVALDAAKNASQEMVQLRADLASVRAELAAANGKLDSIPALISDAIKSALT